MPARNEERAHSSLRTVGLGRLTATALGRSMSMSDLLEYLNSIELDDDLLPSSDRPPTWVGSVGYEKHREVAAFAEMIARAGTELLVDVRELPISRRRGFAKSALAAALTEVGIEYLHMRSMGNPKQFRDLYKSGQVDAGRSAYQRFLLGERRDELEELAQTIGEKHCVLMCVEHDPAVCHRQVILDALHDPVGCQLQVEYIK